MVLCLTDAHAEEISLSSSSSAISFKAQCPQCVDDLRGAFNFFYLIYHDNSVGLGNSIIIIENHSDGKAILRFKKNYFINVAIKTICI